MILPRIVVTTDKRVIDLLDYEAIRRRTARVFELLGEGSQKQCAEDLKMSQSYVSHLLTGSTFSETGIRRLANWAMAEGDLRVALAEQAGR